MMHVKMVAMVFLACLALTGLAREKKLVSCAWEWARTGPRELLELQPQIAASGFDGVDLGFRYPHGKGFHSSYGFGEAMRTAGRR